uniref:3-oxoacyl-[acyl-carrier-protein] reductase n=1 Tax=Leersia perrieri TaxID=77586 RepID=A0A0D9WVZ2_9ORYZ
MVVATLPEGYAAYTASKAAVEAMVRTVAKELKGTRVTANCVAPGATATDMFFAGRSEESVERFKVMNPMGRIGEVGDIAPVVGFLCTDAAEWVNGQVIGANGGQVVVLGYASSAAEADALAAELPRAVAVKADVSDEASVRALFDAAESAFGPGAGGPHILVANAGVLDATYPNLSNTPTAEFDRTIAVNLRGAFLCLREAANRIPRGGNGGGGGRIVAITSSVVASLPTGYAAYTASKAAVEAMVRTMAKELKGTRVTANCVAPGPVATDMFYAGKDEAWVRRTVEANPSGRLGEPGDIAAMVGFLCTDAAEWVNGQVIRVNGGYVS